MKVNASGTNRLSDGDDDTGKRFFYFFECFFKQLKGNKWTKWS